MADYVLTLHMQENEVISIPLANIIRAALVVIAVAVAITVAVVFLVKWIRHRKSSKKSNSIPVTEMEDVPSGVSLSIGKLHSQGKRSSQQDSFFVSPAEMIPTHGLLAVVADGMGGLANGDRVSQTAVSTMAENFFNMKGDPSLLLLALLEQANRAVNHLLGPSGRNKSGSTIVAGLVKDDKFHYISVGDSRICLYRNGILYQLNREHIFRNELLLQTVNGEKTFQAALADKSGAGLTSFLGMGSLKHIDIPAQPIDILPGDRFILMSDGVYNAISEDELKAHLNKNPEDAAQQIGAAIEAKGYTSQDNYTAVILGC